MVLGVPIPGDVTTFSSPNPLYTQWLPGFDPTKPQEEETVAKTNGAIKELREEVSFGCCFFKNQI